MIQELKALKPFIGKYRWWYVSGVLALGLTSGTQLLIPQAVKTAIDLIARDGFKQDLLVPPVLSIILLALIVAVGRVVWRLLIQGAARRIEAELRDKLFSHWIKLGRSYYQKQKTGDLMALATNDLNAVRMSISMALVAAFDGVFMTLSILIILFSTEGLLTFWLIIPLPVITFLILFFGRFVGPLFKGVQESFGTLSRQAQEIFSGIRIIQSYVKENLFLERFKLASKEYQNRNIRLAGLSGLLFPMVGFLSGISTLILLVVGGQAVISGTMSPGSFVANLSYLQLLVWPMLGAGFTVNMLQRGDASMGRINQVLALEPDIVTLAPLPKNKGDCHVLVQNLTFAYPGSNSNALEGLSVEIKPGSWLGITGPIGSGKTTFWQALVRIFPVMDHAIHLDGVDINHLDPDELRSCFAVVPQESFLFSDSLENNVFFARDDRNPEAFNEAVQIATIDRDVKQFNEAWQTEIGERGVSLSGGQKQRIALARALLANRPILILDDSFASVDAETERFMISRLRESRQGKTTIVISHRISAMEACDHILVLSGGTLAQEGSHQKLIQEEGFYQDVWRLQGMESGRPT